MTEITSTKYKCDLCNTLYDTMDEAQYCERTIHDMAYPGNSVKEYKGKERFPLYLYVPFIKADERNFNIQLYKHVDMDSISEENAMRIARNMSKYTPEEEFDPNNLPPAEHEEIPGSPADPNDPQAAVDETGENNNPGDNPSSDVDPVDPNADPEGATDNTAVDPVDDPNASTVDDIDPLNNPGTGTDPSAATDETGSNEGSQGDSGSSVEPIDVGGNNDPDPEEIDP